VITDIQSIKEEIDRVNIEIQQAERNYDLNRAAELKYGKMEELKKKLKAIEAQLENTQISGKTLLAGGRLPKPILRKLSRNGQEFRLVN
jgi:hypothetical protein